MRKLYTRPEADVIEFDVKDVITTSGDIEAVNRGDAVQDEAADWSGWF